MKPMIGPARRYLDRRPSSLAIAISCIAGLVFGALGGGFGLATIIVICALAAFGVWQVVAVLLVISEQLADVAELARPDAPPAPRQSDHADITKTVRIR